MSKESEVYETVARKVVADLKDRLCVSRVEGKQDLAGELSNTNWEVDGVAWREDGEGFLLIEARRYTTSRLPQEDIAAIAYRIIDIGAAGGIVVSPDRLQAGAEKVATANQILHIEVAAESSLESYLADYLGQHFVGASLLELVELQDEAFASLVQSMSISEHSNAQATCDAQVTRAAPTVE